MLSGIPVPAQVIVGPPEHGRNVLRTFLLLRPAETLETRFEYVLPKDVIQVHGRQIEYALLVQKQPGTNALPLDVRILLPADVQLLSSEPAPASQAGSIVDYRLALHRDQRLRVVLSERPPTP